MIINEEDLETTLEHYFIQIIVDIFKEHRELESQLSIINDELEKTNLDSGNIFYIAWKEVYGDI